MTDTTNKWISGRGKQWIFQAYDNKPLAGLSEKVDVSQIYMPDKNEHINLGIHKFNGTLYASNYVGICRLKDVYNRNLVSYDGKEVILKIDPRFNVSVVKMLELIKKDDEFERYLAPQTIRSSSAEKDVEDYRNTEVFHFCDDEAPIFIHNNICKDSSLITATAYISLLKDLCRHPLMGKMINTEENLVGKVKGKILFHQNIRKNLARGREDRLYCRYLRYSEDIPENQILKSALKKSSGYINKYFSKVSSKENSYLNMIAFCDKALSGVSYKNITQRDMSELKFTGCYTYYKPVIALAKMVINEISIESSGNINSTNYIVPYEISMEKLFEMHVRSYLKNIGVKSYSDMNHGIHIQKYDYKTGVLRNNKEKDAKYIAGPVKPDILLYDSNTGKNVVFDIKYKDIDNASKARYDRLQLLAYTLMYNCDNVGIIAPGEDINFCFDKNEIESTDSQSRQRFYHQIKMAISEKWDDEFINYDNSKVNAMDYISSLFV